MNASQTSPASPAPKCHEHHCGRDPDGLPRNGYFKGKMMTARDFTAEQNYFLGQARRHNRHLHGWGIVCGLKVIPHPVCPKERVLVEPGIAIDPQGREIVVPARELKYVDDYGLEKSVLYGAEVDLWPRDPVPPAAATQAPNPGSAPQSAPCRPCGGASHQPASPPYEHSPGSLYLCLHYQECAEEQTTTPFEECGCARKPARLYDGYCVSIAKEPPAAFRTVHEIHTRTRAGNCSDLLERDGCSAPPGDCVPLAVLKDTHPCGEVGPDDIDLHCRLDLVSTAVLTQALLCLLHRPRTHICRFNWGHNECVEFHQFLKRFVSQQCGHDGFEIEFSGELHPGLVGPDTPNPFLFQATFYIYDESDGSSKAIVAPARIIQRPEEPRKLRLKLGEQFGHCLERVKAFDVLIQLRCNFVLDCHGEAVDGNLLAQLKDGQYFVPEETGDRVAGGLFESWLRVRKPGHHHPHY